MTTQDPQDAQAPVVPLDKLASTYRKMRDAITALTAKYEADLAVIQDQQTKIKHAMKDHLLALGATSVKTSGGTVMLNEKVRYTTTNWDAFKKFAVDHDALDLFERRIHQTNLVAFMNDNPGVVPVGLNSMTEYDVSVRKPTT